MEMEITMKKCALHSLGCKVNSYETQAMQKMMESAGYEIVPFGEEIADIYIINTCSVTNIADRKSRQMIHKAKKLNPEAVVAAAGCYVESAGDNIDEDVDIVIGNNEKSHLIEILNEYFEHMDKEKSVDIGKATDFDELNIEKHCWSRTEVASIRGLSQVYRDEKKPEIAILILRKTIESFDKETIGQENACLGKQLLWETLATYLGDVEKYEEAILYAKKGMEKIFENGSAKGISDALYEIAWNERERKAKPEIYQKKYFQALNLSILFQEREFIIFLKEREKKYCK